MSSELSIFDEIQSKISALVSPIKSLTVTDSASNMVAMGTLKTVTIFKKDIEARRVNAVKPINDRVKSVNDYAKNITAPLDEAELFIKKQMTAFAAIEQKRVAEERAKAEEAFRQEQKRIQLELEDKAKIEAAAQAKQKEVSDLFGLEINEGVIALRKIQDEAKAKAEAAILEREQKLKAKAIEDSRPKNTREIWKFEIVSPVDIPDQYWQISETAIGAAVRGGARDIPGVKIYSEMVIVS